MVIAVRKSEIEDIEIGLLLDAVFLRYGYDFRSYARASIDRRTRQFLSQQGLSCVSELIPKILHNENLFSELVQHFSISVTEMFRDPFVYRSVREEVVPVLRTWHHIKVWHAGCSTGEEVYSLAIVFKEEGLLDRTTFYATDLNDSSLAKAKAGIYPPETIQDATRNYQKAGGRSSFGAYYHSRYGAVQIDSRLRDRITFANHNLATDGVFGEMHLVFCRNVLIYFNKDLQDRALRLFTDSLVQGGFLCLGTKEDLQFSDLNGHYEPLAPKAKIYRKRDFL